MPTLPNELMQMISYFIAPWGADTFLGACTYSDEKYIDDEENKKDKIV